MHHTLILMIRKENPSAKKKKTPFQKPPFDTELGYWTNRLLLLDAWGDEIVDAKGVRPLLEIEDPGRLREALLGGGGGGGGGASCGEGGKMRWQFAPEEGCDDVLWFRVINGYRQGADVRLLGDQIFEGVALHGTYEANLRASPTRATGTVPGILDDGGYLHTGECAHSHHLLGDTPENRAKAREYATARRGRSKEAPTAVLVVDVARIWNGGEPHADGHPPIAMYKAPNGVVLCGVRIPARFIGRLSSS